MEDLLFKLSAAGIFVCFPVVVGFFVWKLQTGNEDGVIEYDGLRIDLAALTNIFLILFCIFVTVLIMLECWMILNS